MSTPEDGLAAQHPEPGADRAEVVGRQPLPYPADSGPAARGPAGRHVLFQAPDPVEHVVHPAAGSLLEHAADQLPGRVQVAGQEQQGAQGPIELGEQGAQPDRAGWHLHAEHPLDGQRDPELVAERRQPVVPVRE